MSAYLDGALQKAWNDDKVSSAKFSLKKDGREYDGPTRDLPNDDARGRQASRDCVALFALIGWFGFTLRMLRCGWLVEEFIHDMTVNVGMIPASFFEQVRNFNYLI